MVDHSNSHIGWAKAPEDWTHSRTLARDRRRVGEGFVAGFRTAAGCQPAIQPITNRRYLAGAGGFLKFGSHLRDAFLPPRSLMPWRTGRTEGIGGNGMFGVDFERATGFM